MNLFGQKGFDGTSVREIAAGADVNLAMINYYFGSKEKFDECAKEAKENCIVSKVLNTDISMEATLG